MLDDLLESLFDGLDVGRGRPSRRAQIAARLFFGLLGAALACAGLVTFGTDPGLTRNAALRGAVLALFAGLGCFCLFNVAFARAWRWPGLLLVAGLAGAFIARIAFGR